MTQTNEQPWLAIQISPQERQRWHTIAAQYYEQIQNYLEAALHWRMAHHLAKSAELLVQYYREIVNAGESKKLFELAAQFRKNEISDQPHLWARLKIAIGKAAVLVKNIPRAIQEFEAALATQQLADQVEAYYLLAKTLEKQNIQRSLTTYELGIERCLPGVEDIFIAGIYFDLHLGEAWLYIQEIRDLARARKLIEAAEKIVTKLDAGRKSDLYNAWAGWHYRSGDWAQEIAYRHRAYTLALEAHDRERIVKTGHNLGKAYVMTQNASQIEQGWEYLRGALEVATLICDYIMQGKCQQSIGVGHFYRTEFEDAIARYQDAHHFYQQAEDRNWQGWACHDLAEAYVILQRQNSDPPRRAYLLLRAKEYFTKGQQLNHDLTALDLRDALTKLQNDYPELVQAFFNEQQTYALQYVDQYGRITNREYCQINQCSRAKSERDLEQLVTANLLLREGKGRSVHYRRKPAA